jgi:hypothetical protein
MSKQLIGLLIAGLIGLLVGVWASSLREPSVVHAMTAHGSENKTLVTVPLDAGMEAIVTLDHVTADLTGYVLDRFSGQFFIRYRYNVAADFALRDGKRPRFIMVAGSADFRQFSTNQRLANGVVYVAEEGSGQVVAYGLPWNTQFRASNSGPQLLRFLPMDFAQTRFAEIRN